MRNVRKIMEKISNFVDNCVNEVLKIFPVSQLFIYIRLGMENRNYYGNHFKLVQKKYYYLFTFVYPYNLIMFMFHFFISLFSL